MVADRVAAGLLGLGAAVGLGGAMAAVASPTARGLAWPWALPWGRLRGRRRRDQRGLPVPHAPGPRARRNLRGRLLVPAGASRERGTRSGLSRAPGRSDDHAPHRARRRAVPDGVRGDDAVRILSGDDRRRQIRGARGGMGVPGRIPHELPHAARDVRRAARSHRVLRADGGRAFEAWVSGRGACCSCWPSSPLASRPA